MKSCGRLFAWLVILLVESGVAAGLPDPNLMKLRLSKKFRRAFCAALSSLAIAYNVASLSGQHFTAEPTATPRLTEQARLAKRAELRQAIAEVSVAIKRNPADAAAYLRRASIEKEIAPVEDTLRPQLPPSDR